MHLVNIDKFDLQHNTYQIVLKMIEALQDSYKELILFGNSFGQISISDSDCLIFNTNTISFVYNNGDRFVVNHGDIAAFKVIR